MNNRMESIKKTSKRLAPQALELGKDFLGIAALAFVAFIATKHSKDSLKDFDEELVQGCNIIASGVADFKEAIDEDKAEKIELARQRQEQE